VHQRVLALSLLTLASVVARADTIGPIPLWSGNSPGETGTLGPEHDRTTDADRRPAGLRVTRITNVTASTITIYRPAGSGRGRPAVLVFPGGGYQYLAINIEGTEICEWLNSIGIVGVLVKYRVPPREGLPRFTLPLMDAQRAMGVVRSHAADWGVDPQRVGVIGFSAGAHLSASLSDNFERRTYERVDAADDLSCRPDFAMLLYPGAMLAPDSDKLAAELAPSATTPPTFIVQTEDDSVRVETSVTYYLALKAAHVPVEMHLYASGGHGYGLRPSADPVSTWPARAADWLRGLGVLPPRDAAPGPR
jgi:acetyl esterase/lipase